MINPKTLRSIKGGPPPATCHPARRASLTDLQTGESLCWECRTDRRWECLSCTVKDGQLLRPEPIYSETRRQLHIRRGHDVREVTR